MRGGFGSARSSRRPGAAVSAARSSSLRHRPAVTHVSRAPPADKVEVSIQERLVDIVAEGFDAGVRLSDIIERDMVQAKELFLLRVHSDALAISGDDRAVIL
jgi:hypothetical protein